MSHYEDDRSSVVHADLNSSGANTSKFRNHATNRKHFQRAGKKYELAARLKDPSNPTINRELGNVALLSCIGSGALDIYDAFVFFLIPEQGKDIDNCYFGKN